MKKVVIIAVVILIVIVYFLTIPNNTESFSTEQLNYNLVLGHENISDSNYAISVNPIIRSHPSGDLFILDTEKKQILVFDSKFKFIKRFARDGQAPGELIMPVELNISNKGEILVSDLVNGLVRFDSNLIPMDKIIKFKKMYGSINAIYGRGNDIYVNNPIADRLIEVYDSSGNFKKSFGDMFEIERISAKAALNAVAMTFDTEGFLWVCFKHKPLVRKYDSSGVLIFEKEVTTPFIEKQKQREGKIPLAGGFKIQLYLNDISSLNGKIFLSANKYLIEIDKDMKSHVFETLIPDSNQTYFIDRLTYNSKIKKLLFSNRFMGEVYKIENNF